MGFEYAYKEYLNYASRQHKKQGFETLTNDFKCRILPYFSSYDIFKITSQDILDWQNKLIDLNFKNSYLNKLYVEFNGFFKYCCTYLQLPCNVLKEVGPFPQKFEEIKHDFYTLKEFKHFIKYVDNLVYKSFFTFMFFTGTRPGEAMALKFSDIENGYAHISKTLTNRGGRILDTPKTPSSYRNIKLDKYTSRMLNKLKKYYTLKFGVFSLDYFVFGGPKYISPTTINRYKLKACKKANIRPIKLHEFRHSHATLLLQNGIIINEISRRLGHRKVSTTLDIYTHTDLTQEKRVFNTLNSMRFNFFETLTNDFKKIISILKHFTMF